MQPVLPRRFHPMLKQAIEGQLRGDISGISDLNRYIVSWGLSYLLGDTRHVLERLDTVYLFLNPTAQPYNPVVDSASTVGVPSRKPDIPDFDPHAVRKPKAQPTPAPVTGKGGALVAPKPPKKQRQKSKMPPPKAPDLQGRIVF